MTDMVDMTPMLASMEDAIKMRSQARAQRRAEEAEREKQEFQEKLMRAAQSKAELEGMSMKVKGKQDAVQRDQLMSMMMAGL